MRWWARLIISLDNLTYFIWCWTCFFWIGFNYSNVFVVQTYYVEPAVMLSLSVVLQVLSWAIILSAAARYNFVQSMESNEVASICMDNIWRSTQLFYITAPLQVYSIGMGIKDYVSWRAFKIDISYWEGGDRGVAAKNIVKYWTLLLILGALFSWIWFFTHMGRTGDANISGLFVVSVIALDILHPCAYLWLGGAMEEYAKAKGDLATWKARLSSLIWWRSCIYVSILNERCTGIVKWLGPAQQLAMPFFMLMVPSLGLAVAFTLVIASH